ncbi:MAG: hypothetical protein HRT89_08255 [Lentisphaeria bacterium]|nr:hypothetical protein [Lentisphaeria bacterium]NQZ68047.1 hypothetical protein [Lentisphaeria bacterium]
MKYYILFICILIHSQAASERETLLQSEEEFIVDLLTQKKPDFAQKHLDIIKKVFPKEQDLINRYQGLIYFKKQHYIKAIVHLKKAMSSKNLSKAEKVQNSQYLFLAYVRTANFKLSAQTLKEVEKNAGEYDWYAGACLDLAVTITVASEFKKAPEKVSIMLETMDLIDTFVKRNPKHARISWFEYYQAEHKFNNFLTIKNELDLKKESTALAREQKLEAVWIQFRQTRASYLQLKARYKGMQVERRVNNRIAALEKYKTVLNELERN